MADIAAALQSKVVYRPDNNYELGAFFAHAGSTRIQGSIFRDLLWVNFQKPLTAPTPYSPKNSYLSSTHRYQLTTAS